MFHAPCSDMHTLYMQLYFSHTHVSGCMHVSDIDHRHTNSNFKTWSVHCLYNIKTTAHYILRLCELISSLKVANRNGQWKVCTKLDDMQSILTQTDNTFAIDITTD